MRRPFRLLAVVVVAALTVSFVAAGADTKNQDDPAEVKKGREATLKVAAMIEKKENDAATKEAQALAAKMDEVKYVMKTMALRSNDGLGLGDTPDKIKPDGIEGKIISLLRKEMPAKDLMNEAAALEKMGYVIAAVSEMAIAKTPPKKIGKKDPDDWKKWSKEMHEAALEFADAAKKQDPKALKAAAVKLNSTCSDCHTTWERK